MVSRTLGSKALAVAAHTDSPIKTWDDGSLNISHGSGSLLYKAGRVWPKVLTNYTCKSGNGFLIQDHRAVKTQVCMRQTSIFQRSSHDVPMRNAYLERVSSLVGWESLVRGWAGQHTPLLPALGRQRLKSLVVQGQPGLHCELSGLPGLCKRPVWKIKYWERKGSFIREFTLLSVL